MFGPPDVNRLQAKGDVQGLIKALSYEKDWHVRKASAEALAATDSADSFQALVRAVEDPNSDVRQAVAQTLGALRNPDAVAPLVTLLRGDNDVRLAAVNALGSLRNPAAKDALLGVAIGDRRSEIADAAADALRAIGWAPARDEAGARFWVARGEWSKCVEIGPEAVGALVDALRQGGPSGAAARKALEEIGLPAVPRLVKLRKRHFPSSSIDSVLSTICDAPGLVARHDWDACEKLGGPCIPMLAAALADPSEEVRTAIIRTLGTIGREAVDVLARRLKNADRHIRWQAAEALGGISDPWAVKQLIAARKDSDEYVRQAAEGALAKIAAAHPEIKISPLRAAPKAAGAPKPKMAGKSGGVLKGIWDAGAKPATITLDGVTLDGPMAAFNGGLALKRRNYSSARRAGKRIAVKEATVDLFVAGLYVIGGSIREMGGTYSEFCSVEKELGPFFDDVLVPMAKRIDGGVRVAKIDMDEFPPSLRLHVGAMVGMHQVIEFLNEYAQEVPTTRSDDVDGVSRAGGGKSAADVEKMAAKGDVKGLIKALKDKDGSVGTLAAQALGRIGDESAVAPLLAALTEGDSDVRFSAAWALGKLGGTAAVQPLITALSDESPDVCQVAAASLGHLADAAAVGPLCSALRDSAQPVRQWAATALGAIGDRRATNSLAAVLKDTDGDVRVAAAEALGRLGDPDAVAPLGSALKDEDWAVRLAVVKALANCAGPRRVELLIAALSDDNWSVRAISAVALGHLGDQSAVKPLKKALKDKDADVRRSAAESLKGLA